MAFNKKITGTTPHLNIRSNSSNISNKVKDFAIVSIVHNQAAYITDWIKFHFIAGVKDFLFYIDNCTDNTVEVINSTTVKLGGGYYSHNTSLDSINQLT